jgi:hypothetical protein
LLRYVHRRLEPHRQWHAIQLLPTGMLLAGDGQKKLWSAADALRRERAVLNIAGEACWRARR